MEAPEKIYINPNIEHRMWLIGKGDTDFIKYVKEDAFIEMAEEFIYIALNDGIMGTANIEDFMRLFKNYMKRE